MLLLLGGRPVDAVLVRVPYVQTFTPAHPQDVLPIIADKAVHLPRGVEREGETTAVWSEKCVARCGSEYDDMRMITTRFVRVLQRRAGPLCTHFLLIFPEVRSTNKTSK